MASVKDNPVPAVVISTTDADFEPLRQVFTEAKASHATEVFADGKLTATETKSLFESASPSYLYHTDGTSEVEVEFFDVCRIRQKTGVTHFDEVLSILKRHGFNIYGEVGGCGEAYLQVHDTNPGKASEYQTLYGNMVDDPDFLAVVCKYVQDPEKFIQNLPPPLRQDRSYLARLVEINGALLPFLTSEEQADPGIAAAALKNKLAAEAVAMEPAPKADLVATPNFDKLDRATALAYFINSPDEFKNASDIFKNDREFVLVLIAAMPNPSEKAIQKDTPEKFKDDPSFRKTVLLSLCQRGVEAITEALPVQFQDDPDVIGLAAGLNGRALQYASTRLKSDFDFCVGVVAKQESAAEFVAPVLCANLHFALTVLTLAKEAIFAGYYFIQKLPGGDTPSPEQKIFRERAYLLKDILEGSIHNTLGYIAGANFAGQSETKILAQLIVTDWRLLEFVDDGDNPELWQEIRSVLAHQRVWPPLPPLPPEMLTGKTAFMKGLQDLTDFPRRFRSFATIATLIHPDPTIVDERPIALVMYPKADWNTAFEQYPLVDDLVESGKFHVVYREIATDTEWLATLKEVSQDGKVPIHSLVTGGHGTPLGISLSGYYATEGEEKLLDPSDWSSGQLAEARKYLAGTTQVINESCSNGLGGESNPTNMANLMAKLLPPTGHVISSQIPSNICNFRIQRDGSFFVLWYGNRDYIVSGREGE